MKNNWQKIKLGDICTLIKGITYKSDDYASTGDGLVFLTLKSIAKGGGFNFDGVKYYKGETHDDQFVAPNDLIIANTDLTRAGDIIGAPLFVPQIDKENKYVYSMDITKIVTDESRLNRNYLYHYLLTKNVRNYMREISNGSTVLHLKINLVNKLDIPLPLLEIQSKIVQILSSIDAEIQYTDQIIQKTEVLKKGLMQELLTKGINHKKFKKTKIGEIPEGWNIERFEEFAMLQRGYDLPVQNRIRGEYELVTSNGVTDTHNQFKVKGPGIVTGRSGTLGKVFYIEKDFWPLNTTLYIKNFHGNNKKFIYYKIQSFNISRFGTGTGVPTLNRNNVHKELIAIPGYIEQQEIAEIISIVDEKISVNKIIKTKLVLLKMGLMQDIFSQKVPIN